MTTLLGGRAGTWAVDTAASTARFRARDVLHRQVSGTLPLLAAGVEVSPEGDPLRVWADLDLAGVSTGSARRDRDLRGPRFFDVESGGVLGFRARAARDDGSGGWQLSGELVLNGVRCRVEVAARLVGAEDGRARVQATTTLDRRDVGITVPRLLVGRSVGVVVDAVLLAPVDAR